MDLTSGQLYWPTLTTATTYPALQKDIRCEVVILGGGITGALVAYHLLESGMDVVLLEKRKIGAGSTSASTALLQYEVDTHLIDLKRKVGETQAIRAYELCLGAIGKIEGLTQTLGDSCGFERKQSLYLASHNKDVRTLYEEYAARKDMGIDLEFLEGATLEADYSLHRPAALLSSVAAQVDPFRLASRLIEDAVTKGLRVFEQTEIVSLEGEQRLALLEGLSSTNPITLQTTSDLTIQAKQVVFATGYESQQYLSQNVVNLNSSYAFVSEPLDLAQRWQRDFLIWETARPYLYTRTTSEGRLLVGGEDVAFRNPNVRDLLLNRKAKKLQRRFHKLFPSMNLDIARVWAGTFGETKDGLPHIGKTPEYPNAYFALGYGGNGITYSLIAAELIRDILLGHSNPDIQIFSFDR